MRPNQDDLENVMNEMHSKLETQTARVKKEKE